MELVVSLAIGVLAGSGIWLLLRPRTFQVTIGLALLSYAVNLFIFSTGGLRTGADAGGADDAGCTAAVLHELRVADDLAAVAAVRALDTALLER